MGTDEIGSVFARACSGKTESPKISPANLVAVGGGNPEPEPKTVAEKMFPGLEPIKEAGPRQPLSALQAAVSGQTAQDPVQQPAQRQVDGLVEVERGDIVPVTMNDYHIPVENADPKLSEWFKQTAYDAGLTRKAAANVAVRYQAMLDSHMEGQRKASEETSKAVDLELKSVWGENFSAHSHTVREFTKNMTDSAFNALVSRLLHEHASKSR